MIPPILSEGIREMLIINRNTGMMIERQMLYEAEQYTPMMDYMIKVIDLMKTPGVRLYMSVNSRSVKKAIKEFKHQQVDADLSEHSNAFYINLSKKFRHILMQPKQRKTKYFLIDIDTKELTTITDVLAFLTERKIMQITNYETPNGHHVICDPFNLNELKRENVEIKTDGLMLLYSGRAE